MKSSINWQSVKSWLEQELFSIGTFSLSIYQIVTALLIIVAGMIIANMSSRALKRVVSLRSQIPPSQVYTMTRLLTYSIYVLVAFAALSALGITFDKIAIVAGALSVGVGFGLQNIVNNFISGIILLFEKTLRVGDFVELETGVVGEVRAIKIRSTLIRTLSNEDILVPNSQFISNQVTNWTLDDDYRRMSVEFGVAYGTDPHMVIEAVREVASKHPDAVKEADKMPGVIFTGFGDSSLNFKLVIWLRGEMVKKPGLAVSNFLLLVHDVLKDRKIEVPFPQRDLHIRSGLYPVKSDGDLGESGPPDVNVVSRE
jgi:small-conductance mechanosensitive channel